MPQVENTAETTTATTKKGAKKKAAPKRKATAKKAPKKGAKKKAAKKAAPKELTKGPAEYGVERTNDLPWGEKKAAVIKAMQALKCFDVGSAKDTATIAMKADVSNRDVRHYVYHAVAGGLTKVVDVEGARGFSFHLTAKGRKTDVKAELKARAAAKKK